MSVAVICPLQGHDLASPATGQEQQFDGGREDMAVMPVQSLAQAAGFLPGQKPFAAKAPVPPDVQARIASFRAVSEDFGFPHDHRQDRHRPVGGCGRRPERCEPLPDIPARDGTDRLPTEPGKDPVLQVPAVDPERARFPVSCIAAEYGLRDVPERSLCQGFH